MPFVTFAERYGREMGEIDGRKEGRYEAMEVALDLRFPDSLAELMPQFEQIEDRDRLNALLQLTKKAPLADIQAAIESAVAMTMPQNE